MTTTANKAIICYDNLLASSKLLSIAATSQQAGYSVQNCYDWQTTSYWSPTPSVGYHYFTATFTSPVTADYLAIYKHNLGDVGGTFYLEYSLDSGSTWQLATTTITSAINNELKINLFNAVTATHWRVVFNLYTATPFYIGVVMFGRKLPLYRGMVGGFVVPRHGRKNEIINQTTEGGQFVGRIKVSKGARSNITFKTVPQMWVRDYWEAFVLHAEMLPFLFSWNHEFYPQDACFCVTDGEIPSLAINENRFHDISLPVMCLLSGIT
ncbi:discoidin domain-containing protein [Agitococcus lubricus]|uniref:F5/8 type C domain-containing protein n=1 Tax=Agitococcus lubricus TaxID=1077255 RepID=A0A2T5J0J7_9GAMM|nr:discoidin domain-containing protein [Agitococcus lubricus]PTQ89791.1 F5/8 type C domain-containing protein [Agitococcus lubricus]